MCASGTVFRRTANGAGRTPTPSASPRSADPAPVRAFGHDRSHAPHTTGTTPDQPRSPPTATTRRRAAPRARTTSPAIPTSTGRVVATVIHGQGSLLQQTSDICRMARPLAALVDPNQPGPNLTPPHTSSRRAPFAALAGSRSLLASDFAVAARMLGEWHPGIPPSISAAILLVRALLSYSGESAALVTSCIRRGQRALSRKVELGGIRELRREWSKPPGRSGSAPFAQGCAEQPAEQRNDARSYESREVVGPPASDVAGRSLS